jgi:hypothetical protein
MLPETIRSTLKKKISIDELQKFMNRIDNNSFEFNIGKMNLEIDNLFYFDAFLQDVKIDNKKYQCLLKKI